MPSKAPALGTLSTKDLPAQPHVFLGHLVSDSLDEPLLMNLATLTMMNGDRHFIRADNGRIRTGGVRMLMKNIAGQNGLAHVIMPSFAVSPYAPKKNPTAARFASPQLQFDPLALPAATAAPQN